MGDFQVFLVQRAHTQASCTVADQTDAIWESSEACATVSFNSQCSFHLFILRQERTDSVCTVSPQIKHSLCIPYEMYLLRFGRGGRQVLCYIKSEGPPFAQRDWLKTVEEGYAFHNKSRVRQQQTTVYSEVNAVPACVSS